jgi:hypothetical protein
MVDKDGEMALIRREGQGALGQHLREHPCCRHWHDPILLSLPVEQLLERDRFDGKASGSGKDHPVLRARISSEPRTFGNGLCKSCSDLLDI